MAFSIFSYIRFKTFLVFALAINIAMFTAVHAKPSANVKIKVKRVANSLANLDWLNFL